MFKTCYKCKLDKRQAFFHKDKTKQFGFSDLCKDCTKIRDKKRKPYFDSRKNLKRKYDKNYKQENKEQIKAKSLKYVYGFSIEEYKHLVKTQKNKCAICKKYETLVDYRTNKIRDLSVDHCHKTNGIRGLLCSKCNMAIGLLEDNIKLLENAIKYLKNNI